MSYTDLVKKIIQIRKPTDYKETKIIKKARISYDGKQFLVRIPTELARLFEIKQGQYLEFMVDVPYFQEKKERVAVVSVKER